MIQPPISATSRRTRIVALGDSTTAGTPGFLSPVESPPAGRGNPESQYSYWMAKAHPGWDVLNKGVNGQRSDQILSRFERDVVAERPRIVIVLAGVNDIYQGRGLDSIKRNLDAIYSAARSEKIVVVAATVLPYNIAGKRESEAIRQLNLWIAHGVSEDRLFCDTNLAVRNEGNPDLLASSPDEIHPDVEGYKRMGVALSETLVRAGF